MTLFICKGVPWSVLGWRHPRGSLVRTGMHPRGSLVRTGMEEGFLGLYRDGGTRGVPWSVLGWRHPRGSLVRTGMEARQGDLWIRHPYWWYIGQWQIQGIRKSWIIKYCQSIMKWKTSVLSKDSHMFDLNFEWYMSGLSEPGWTFFSWVMSFASLGYSCCSVIFFNI